MARSLRNNKSGADQPRQGESSNTIPPQMRDAAQAYEGKSQQELMGELMRITQQQKAAGELDDAGIDAIAGSILPMLSPEQREKMDSILRYLKGN